MRVAISWEQDCPLVAQYLMQAFHIEWCNLVNWCNVTCPRYHLCQKWRTNAWHKYQRSNKETELYVTVYGKTQHNCIAHVWRNAHF